MYEALARFCEGRATFPTAREFDEAGRTDLRRAVADYGGTAYWAEQLRLPLGPRQDRRAYTLEEAVTDARAVVAELGELPSAPRLRAMGLNRLATRVKAAGGAKRFSRTHLNAGA